MMHSEIGNKACGREGEDDESRQLMHFQRNTSIVVIDQNAAIKNSFLRIHPQPGYLV